MPRECKISIRYMPPSERSPEGYLGATVSYAPVPGEAWSRGSDLAGGPASTETLGRIARDIAAVMAGRRNADDMDKP